MSERLKSVKVPFSAWQALTRICASSEEPRTQALARLIYAEEKRVQAETQPDRKNE